MTHAELQQRMTGTERAYWMALYRIEERERVRAEERAADKAKAQEMSRSFSHLGP